MIDFMAIAEEAIHAHGAMQKRVELAGLLALARGLNPRVVYEIGTATAGTLWALARAINADLYVSIDLPGGPFSGGATTDPRVPLAEIIGAPARALYGDSRTVEFPEEPPELLLIDGDHSFEGVKADWERWGPLVQAGGIVVFHDILPHPEATGVQVAPLWSEVSQVARTVEFVDPTDLGPAGNQWGGLGVVFR